MKKKENPSMRRALARSNKKEGKTQGGGGVKDQTTKKRGNSDLERFPKVGGGVTEKNRQPKEMRKGNQNFSVRGTVELQEGSGGGKPKTGRAVHKWNPQKRASKNESG